MPAMLSATQVWASEPAMVAVNNLAQLVMGLEALDTRQKELISDQVKLERNIEYLEEKLKAPGIPAPYREDLERSLRIEKQRLNETLERLDHSIKSDQEISKELYRSYS
jgi:hypothetical protein